MKKEGHFSSSSAGMEDLSTEEEEFNFNQEVDWTFEGQSQNSGTPIH